MRPLRECVPLSILVSDRVELALFGAAQKGAAIIAELPQWLWHSPAE